MKLKFYLFTFLLLFSRGCDFYSTSLWIFEPGGLAHETNPLTRFFNVGWNGLLLANFIVVALIIAAYYYYSFHYRRPSFDPQPNNYREYASLLYFNRKDRWHWLFYKLPHNRKASMAHMGYVLVRTVIVASLLATFHNLCQFYDIGFYNTYRELVGRPLYVIYALIGLTAVFFHRHLLQREFRSLNGN